MMVNLRPVSFTPEKVPICWLSRRLDKTQSLPGTLGEDKDLLPHAGLRTADRPDSSLGTVLLCFLLCVILSYVYVLTLNL